jgi:hypothetical protein
LQSALLFEDISSVFLSNLLEQGPKKVKLRCNASYWQLECRDTRMTRLNLAHNTVCSTERMRHNLFWNALKNMGKRHIGSRALFQQPGLAVHLRSQMLGQLGVTRGI